jgi:hypothetical protein
MILEVFLWGQAIIERGFNQLIAASIFMRMEIIIMMLWTFCIVYTLKTVGGAKWKTRKNN